MQVWKSALLNMQTVHPVESAVQMYVPTCFQPAHDVLRIFIFPSTNKKLVDRRLHCSRIGAAPLRVHDSCLPLTEEVSQQTSAFGTFSVNGTVQRTYSTVHIFIQFNRCAAVFQDQLIKICIVDSSTGGLGMRSASVVGEISRLFVIAYTNNDDEKCRCLMAFGSLFVRRTCLSCLSTSQIGEE
jgi:hypothetical protein